ncbi:hypothetical protein C8Q70DRAFT_570279 [Cubamyces menziesii]|nr:hypothetical protein C8Q70DRAFT_570279 [Cubamyces menziesii]
MKEPDSSIAETDSYGLGYYIDPFPTLELLCLWSLWTTAPRPPAPSRSATTPQEIPRDLMGDVPLETSQFIGVIGAAITYGLHIAVFWQCMYYILPQAIRHGTRTNAGLLAYVIITFALGTVTMACNARLAQLMLVNNRTYPGGPSVWLSSHTEDAVNVLGTISYMLCVFLADGLLLWRTYILWESRLSILVLPLLLYLADTALSVPTILELAYPSMGLQTRTAVPFTLLYFSMAISLTTLLHLLLVVRLMYMSYRARRSVGREYAATYISIYTMIVESAAPYTVTCLVFIACYARNSNAQNVVLPILGQVMCINPELLILRVARGRAVSSVKADRLKAPHAPLIQFRPASSTMDSVSRSTTT